MGDRARQAAVLALGRGRTGTMSGTSTRASARPPAAPCRPAPSVESVESDRARRARRPRSAGHRPPAASGGTPGGSRTCSAGLAAPDARDHQPAAHRHGLERAVAALRRPPAHPHRRTSRAIRPRWRGISPAWADAYRVRPGRGVRPVSPDGARRDASRCWTPHEILRDCRRARDRGRGRRRPRHIGGERVPAALDRDSRHSASGCSSFDGRPSAVPLEAAGTGRWAVDAPRASDGTSRWWTSAPGTSASLTGATRKPGGGALKAPMPGLVVRVQVELGQAVARGTARGGARGHEDGKRAQGPAGPSVISAVRVEPGQAVEKGRSWWNSAPRRLDPLGDGRLSCESVSVWPRVQFDQARGCRIHEDVYRHA